MLILARKKKQSILIGDNIKITIVDVQNNLVKIGIEASRDLTILREELIVEVEKENQKAIEIDVNSLEKLSEMIKRKNKGEKEI